MANWTEQRKLPLTLARFCVQLDQRMLSALAQTGAQHAKFFEKSGRARLLKVLLACFHSTPELLTLEPSGSIQMLSDWKASKVAPTSARRHGKSLHGGAWAPGRWEVEIWELTSFSILRRHEL